MSRRFDFRTHRTLRSVIVIITAVVFLLAGIFYATSLVQSNATVREQIFSTEKDNLDFFKSSAQAAFDQIAMINAAFSGLYMMDADSPDGGDSLPYDTYSVLLKQITLCTAMCDFIGGAMVENQSYQIEKGTVSGPILEENHLGIYKNCQLYLARNPSSGRLQLSFFQAAADELSNDVTIAVDGRSLGKQLMGNYRPHMIKFITDKSGTVLIANRNDHIGENVFSLFGLEEQTLGGEPGNVTLDEEAYILSSTQMEGLELYCVALTAYSAYDGNTAVFTQRNMLLGGILIIVAIIFAFILSYLSYRPIYKVLQTAQDYYPLTLNENRDEVAAIQNILKSSHRDNLALKDQLGNTTEELRRQQILALQSQISPHFMYNVLDSINWMSIALNGEDNAVSDCARNTQALFAYCMKHQTIFATLRDEIEITKNMVSILSRQYDLNITVTERIPANLESCQLLKLCLEPIFENAIIHGYANYMAEGEIIISVSSQRNKLSIKIQDFGMGMTKEEIKSLMASIRESPSEQGGRIGLRNINYRLRLLFGEEYQLQIKSERDRGTTFTIQIPLLL